MIFAFALRFQAGADLEKRVDDADDGNKDNHIGREKIHDKLEYVFFAIGGRQRVDPEQEEDDRKNGNHDVLEPPKPWCRSCLPAFRRKVPVFPGAGSSLALPVILTRLPPAGKH
jgi:hypothetical protein